VLGHLPKETRARNTWQHVEAELKKAAAGSDATQVSIAPQTVLQLNRVEHRTAPLTPKPFRQMALSVDRDQSY
jgi:hypothetical protein